MQHLPVPEADASTAIARLDATIELLDTAITTRAVRANDLASWAGLGRSAWDEQFAYSQGDLAVALDDLQAVRAEIGRRLDDIRHHNVHARVAHGGLVPDRLVAGSGRARP